MISRVLFTTGFLLPLFNGILFAQVLNVQEPGYYVVIGSFAIQNNASKFAQKLNKEGSTCKYFFDSTKQIYYVYKSVIQRKSEAQSAVYELRKDERFYDAWLRRFPAEQNVLSVDSTTRLPKD